MTHPLLLHIASFRQSVRERFERVVPSSFAWARWPHPLCASSPRQLLRNWVAASYCIADFPMGGRRFVHICGHRHFTLNVSFWTKDPPRRCADILCIFAYNHCSLPLPLTTTYYLRQNCRSSPPHLYSSVIAQILLDCPDEDLQSASCFATLALAQAVNSSASAGLKSTPTPSVKFCTIFFSNLPSWSVYSIVSELVWLYDRWEFNLVNARLVKLWDNCEHS